MGEESDRDVALAKIGDFKIGGRITNKVRLSDYMAIISKTKEELRDLMINTGRNYGLEINIDKAQIMRISKKNKSLRIKKGYRAVKEVDHFQYLCSK